MSILNTHTQKVLEVLTTAKRQEKDRKGIWIAKKEMKLSLFADSMIMYIENPKEHTKTPRNSELSKFAGYKISTKN